MPSDSVVDFWGSFPTPGRVVAELSSWYADAGYSDLFANRWCATTGVPRSVADEAARLASAGEISRAEDLVRPLLDSPADLVERFRAAGVEHTVLHAPLPTGRREETNREVAELVEEFPNDLTGFIRVDPAEPSSVSDLARYAALPGMRGMTLTPFWHRISVLDDACLRLFEECERLGLVAWVHTSINYVTDRPYSLEHPTNLDYIAAQFPELTIVAGHAGWPWVPDMVAVALRHQNVIIDFSAFRSQHLATPGTGWEMLHYFMQRGLSRQVVFGTTWTLLGRPLEDVVAEARSVEFRPEMRPRWLASNARRVLGLKAEGDKEDNDGDA